jgi:hypothetical protein
LAGPYLKSGESIILTTDRVLIDDIEYDLILTSQRLALVDSDHTSDQPQAVPFATILSVKGGNTPAREPFITLTIIDPVGLEDSKTIDLIFSQQPYEDRAAECDLWVQKLIENIVSVRQEPATAATQQVPSKPQEGMNPTIRRFGAPEVPLPHSQVAQKSRRPSEELLSAIQGTAWDTPDDAVVPPVPENQKYPEDDVQPVPDDETGPAVPATASNGEEPVSSPVPEELVDLIKAGPPQKNADIDRPIIPAEESPTVPVEDDEPVNPAGVPDYAAVPVTPFGELVPRETETEPESSPDEGQDGEEPVPQRNATEFTEPVKNPGIPGLVLPELLLHLKNLPEPEIPDLSDPKERDGSQGMPARLPVNSATGGSALSGETPVPGGDIPDHRDGSGIPMTVVQTGLPDTIVFPVLFGASSEDVPETPVAGTPPAVLSPIEKQPVSQSGKIPVRVIAAIIVVLLVIIGGTTIIFLLPSGNPGSLDQPTVTPVNQTPVPVTTTPQVMIPAEGVWVKVTYNGTFVGSYGNPGAQKEVRGTGEQVYAIKNADDLVQASFTKQDDYGNNLTVEVYNNGTLVTQVTKRTPRGTISILIDPKTGKAPYVPVTTIGS